MTLNRHRLKVPSEGIKALHSLLEGNTTKTADRIGVTPGTITKVLREGTCTLTLELAANYWVEQMTRPKGPVSDLPQAIREYYGGKTVVDLSPQDFDLLNKTIREVVSGEGE